MIAAIIIESLLKFVERMVYIVIALIALLGVALLLLDILPADPLQMHIQGFTATLAPYTALLNYFVPMAYCWTAFCFFITYKYIIYPVKKAIQGISQTKWELGTFGYGTGEGDD